MASLKELKDRIGSVKSTQKITKAKQMVAAAKLRRAQSAAEAARPYAERLSAVMASLATKVSGDSAPKLLAGTALVKNPGFEEADAAASELIEMFEAGAFDVAHLVFPTFKSALAQDPTTVQLIPVPSPENTAGGDAMVEYEPGEEEILKELLPRYVKTQIFGGLLEREASEQGASMTAMDNATRNAGELINKLTIQYNRSRQAAITTELIEIIAGAEAL